tara:strand:+ start:135 stop:347 length:213 start_codon:yes stop_codon:yes gene_type:complete
MKLKPKTEKVRSRNQAFKDMVRDMDVEKLAAKWAVEDYNEHYFNGEKDYAPETSDVLEFDDIDDNDYYLD